MTSRKTDSTDSTSSAYYTSPVDSTDFTGSAYCTYSTLIYPTLPYSHLSPLTR